jgi:hypothetical protein
METKSLEIYITKILQLEVFLAFVGQYSIGLVFEKNNSHKYHSL